MVIAWFLMNLGHAATKTGAGRRTVAKSIALDGLPDRRRSTIKPMAIRHSRFEIQALI
jgi:hypothetical protein